VAGSGAAVSEAQAPPPLLRLVKSLGGPPSTAKSQAGGAAHVHKRLANVGITSKQALNATAFNSAALNGRRIEPAPVLASVDGRLTVAYLTRIEPFSSTGVDVHDHVVVAHVLSTDIDVFATVAPYGITADVEVIYAQLTRKAA
jgi:hypothetical protein